MIKFVRHMRPAAEERQARRADLGQVIVLFALFLVVLVGAAALVLDVARAYTLQRFESSVADAAALAGAQDLQIPDTRDPPGIPEQTNARTDALRILVNELGGTAPLADQLKTCGGGTLDFANCPISGTPYEVSVTTPYPGAQTVEAIRAVKVVVAQPKWALTFARIPPFDGTTWNVASASVAGLFPSPQYAVVTLQPPNIKNNGTDANKCQDLVVDGNNTWLNLTTGDVGTNTSAATTNQGLITLQSGYYIYHYDDITNIACGLNMNPTWTVDANGNPQGLPINSLIQDPGYYYAQFPTSSTTTPAPTFAHQGNGAINCTDPTVNFPTDTTTVTFLTPVSGGTLTCYKPGIYSSPFTVSNKDVAYLAPGAYWFQGGVTVNSILAGGLVDSQPGVVLVFPESGSQNQFLANNSNSVIVLNTGSRSCIGDGCRATAATDFAGKVVQTDTSPAYPLTVEVLRDSNCFVGTDPSYTGCAGDLNGNKTVKLTAGQLVQIAGVLYGPSDNMQITGGSKQEGMLGQLYSWTVTYTGGSKLTQDYPGAAANEVLRLDTACSPGVACP